MEKPLSDLTNEVGITLAEEKEGEPMKNKHDLKTKNFLFLTIAGMINAFGVTVFLYPMKLYDSGISGLSMLLDQLTPDFLSLPLFLVAINFPIFLFGLKRQGVSFTVYSLFAIGIYSLSSFLIMDVLPFDVVDSSPLAGEDLLLCAIFGGLISGIGSGLTIRFGGAIDGIDVLSVCFAKKLGLSLGNFVMLFNAVLYVCCGILNQGKWIVALYSVVAYFIGSKTVDYIVDGFDREKCAMIITKSAKEITSVLQESFSSSGTIVKGLGAYSGDSKEIIYFIVNHFEVNKVKNIVHEIDPQAFIALYEISDVIKRTDG